MLFRLEFPCQRNYFELSTSLLSWAIQIWSLSIIMDKMPCLLFFVSYLSIFDVKKNMLKSRVKPVTNRYYLFIIWFKIRLINMSKLSWAKDCNFLHWFLAVTTPNSIQSQIDDLTVLVAMPFFHNINKLVYLIRFLKFEIMVP